MLRFWERLRAFQVAVSAPISDASTCPRPPKDLCSQQSNRAISQTQAKNTAAAESSGDEAPSLNEAAVNSGSRHSTHSQLRGVRRSSAQDAPRRSL